MWSISCDAHPDSRANAAMLDTTTIYSLAVSAVLAFASGLDAQVVITEVHPDESWIELHNRGATTVDLSDWAVYCATDTPARVQTYWWGFAPDTEIAPDAFLRVNWFHPAQAATATDVYTGDGFHDFLFLLGGESLQRTAGAVALLSSSDGDEMGNPLIYRDWVAWGAAGLARSVFAEDAGLWTPGTFVAAPPAGSSIALASEPTAEPTPVSDFFHDATPSPLARNNAGAVVRHYGHACAVGAMNAPSLEAVGVPSVGNDEFTIRAHGTYGAHGQTIVFLLGLQEGDGGIIPIPELACPLWVSGPVMLTYVRPATFGSFYTDLPFSLAGFGQGAAGLTLYMQAFGAVLPFTEFDYTSSGGIAITLGG